MCLVLLIFSPSNFVQMIPLYDWMNFLENITWGEKLWFKYFFFHFFELYCRSWNFCWFSSFQKKYFIPDVLKIVIDKNLTFSETIGSTVVTWFNLEIEDFIFFLLKSNLNQFIRLLLEYQKMITHRKQICQHPVIVKKVFILPVFLCLKSRLLFR